MSHQIDFFKSESKALFKQYNSQMPDAIRRVQANIKDTDGFCLAKAQHVVARESGFNKWADLIHADTDRLRFGIILYQHPWLTMMEGWSCPDDPVNPYSDDERQALIDNFPWIMRIVSWLRQNGIRTPINSDDEYYFHTGTGKDCFSRLFVHLYNEPYQYTGTGIVIAAFMICGFKPLNLDDFTMSPEPGQGRCYFAISEQAWNTATAKYPMLIR